MKKKLTYREKIYTYQIDYVGHVNNISYIQWMENGRVRLMEAIGMPIPEIAIDEGIVPVLTETTIKYKKPFYLNNDVIIETWLSKLNNASAIIEFRFYNENKELCSSGQQKGLFINRATGRPSRLAQNHRKAFEKYLNLSEK